jgi:hypothetical protein
MNRTSQLILPGINYFQLVFTIPDRLSGLVLGNRRELYRLLFRSAWRAIQQELKKQNIDPAALLVLHTWNQELGHHPHIHAIVPGGGPSLNQDNDPCWVTARDVTRPWRDKPSLVDNVTLGRTFRDKFVRGLGWLIRNDKLKLDDEWRLLRDPNILRRWLKSLKETDWNVFIEGPPHGQSDPQQVLKYLARYLTGGPLSDRRIESDHDGMVTFTAREKASKKESALHKKKGSGPPRQVHIPGAEFVRRWSLHILPKSFTRSRACGGYHGRNRQKYLDLCRQLLQPAEPKRVEPLAGEPALARSDESVLEPPRARGPLCPHCEIEMDCIEQRRRPSWRALLSPSTQNAQVPAPDD